MADAGGKMAASLEKTLRDLAAFSSGGPGVSRLPFTAEARGAADYLKAAFESAGLEAWEDGFGNVFGRLRGTVPGGAVVMGSHYDSVPQGGMFDGAAGVAAALEIARTLKERGCSLKRDFVAAALNDEEGVRFQKSCLGSAVMLGRDFGPLLGLKDRDGVPLDQALRAWGKDPAALPSAAWDWKPVRAFVELHIEQGPVLDQAGLDLGLVEAIVGFRRWIVTIHGRADHSGTTPMNLRSDAVDAASQVISRLCRWAGGRDDGTVFTAGYWRVEPSMINVVPRLCQFSAEVRSRNGAALDECFARLKASLAEACGLCRTSFEMELTVDAAPTALDGDLTARLEAICRHRGFSFRRMASGAGHDAQEIAAAAPAVMIFVPSREGRSHCPEEWTDFEALARGTAAACDLVSELTAE